MILLFMMGCIKYAPVTPAYVFFDRRYGIQVEGVFSTPDASEEAWKEEMSGFSVELDWLIGLSQIESHRDDSMWLRLEVLESSYQLDDGSIQLLPSTATGRVVDLRVFPWGELLEIRYLDHLSGDGRWLDVFEPILPGLLPSPPVLKKGEEKPRTNRWPVVEGEETIARSRQPAEWKREEDEDGFWVYSYQGRWESDERSGIRFENGASQGRVWIDPASRWVEKHEWQWERELQDTEILSHVQHQVFEGRIWRIH